MSGKFFTESDPEIPEAVIDLSHVTRPEPLRGVASVQALDLTGKPKIVMAIGLGGTGKTTLLRWVAERATERDDGDQVALATVDPVNRELGYYFPAVMAPPTQDPARISAWLEKLLTSLMAMRKSAAIDFGGGDTSLGRLVGEVPDLLALMEDAGVEPVAFYMLSPRTSDLTPLAAMERAGFRPRATALILNLGRSDPTRDQAEEFARIRGHSTWRTALARGAIEVWMPRLHAAKAIEDRRIGFRRAATGLMPGEHSSLVLNAFDRTRARHWLAAMDDAFSPILSWLP